MSERGQQAGERDGTQASDDEDLPAELARTHERLERADERVSAFGREELEELADAYHRFTGLLDRYEDQVVGDAGDYKTNIEFQSQIADLASDLTEDMVLYETFAECDEYLQQRWFSTADFEHVRDQLEPVADLVDRLDEHQAARSAYRTTRRRVRHRLQETEERIDTLERLTTLAEADLDAPTDRLRRPIEQYNTAIEAAFEEFLREASAREVVDFLETMEAYPLVAFPSPPDELVDYLESEPPGEESISKLLDYATYSRSKLDHYVEDPDTLKHVIGGQKTFLSGLSADPLTVEWPPPPALDLRWRSVELTAAANRVAPEVMTDLRAVTALPRETDYERLRNSILAAEELSPAERERVEAGDIDAELERVRERRDRLRDALETYPEL